jgi:hypothetical protein
MRKALLSGIALLVAGMVAAGAGSAGASGVSSGNQLAGTWVVTVNRPAPLPPLTSLQIFTGDGSVIEDANEASATRTASFGSWERIEGRLYAATAVMFRFDPQTGAHIATMKINRTIRLSEDGQSFAHAARVSVSDPAGNLLQSFPVLANGNRMPIERIPDVP